jgi:hypothetical protein
VLSIFSNMSNRCSCERHQARLPENDAQYAIDLGLESSGSPENLTSTLFPRTPLRQVNSNYNTPHRPATVGKTPGTMMFDARLQAIRDAYPQPMTPSFSDGKENWDDSDVGMSMINLSPTVQKSCPAKQAGGKLFVLDEDDEAMVKRDLFKGQKARKSMGVSLKRQWVDEE